MSNKPKEHCETGANIRQTEYDSKKKSQSGSDKVIENVRNQVNSTLNKGK